jgi:hypothetical protein
VLRPFRVAWEVTFQLHSLLKKLNVMRLFESNRNVNIIKEIHTYISVVMRIKCFLSPSYHMSFIVGPRGGSSNLISEGPEKATRGEG